MTFVRIYIQTVHALATEMVDIYHLHGMLGAIDEEINQLNIQRQKIINKISTVEECSAMSARANIFADIIKSISTIQDPETSLKHTSVRLLPFIHNLPQKYFENLHAFWRVLRIQSKWTSEQAADVLVKLSSALERDVAVIEGISGDMSQIIH